MENNTVVRKLQSFAKANLVLCWVCLGICIILSLALGFAAFVTYIIFCSVLLLSAYISFYLLNCFAAILKTVSNIEQLMMTQNKLPPIPDDTYATVSTASAQAEQLPEL